MFAWMCCVSKSMSACNHLIASAKIGTKNNRRMAFKQPFAYFLLIATNYA